MKSRILQRLDEQLAVYRHRSDNVDLILTAYSLFEPLSESVGRFPISVLMSIIRSFEESTRLKTRIGYKLFR